MKLAIRIHDAHEDGTQGFLLSEQTHEISRAIALGAWTVEDASSIGNQIMAAALDTEDDHLQISVEVEDDE
jgi:hypothetical protein